MRAVNLARRPFVNRQPVLRLAGLLWLIGVILLLINIRLYSSHWRGSADYRQQLAQVGEEIRVAEQQLNEHNPALSKANIPQENSRTKFLNSLISYRMFPWSALFDDLEDVVPIDIRLTSVRPAVQLVVEPPKPRRRQTRPTPRRSTSRRRSQAAEARAAEAVEASAEKETPPTELKRNEVMLDIVGVAKTQEALMEFIDVLYASSSFRNPFLPGETVNLQDGSTSFSIDVIYLTRSPGFDETGPTEDAEDAATASEGDPSEGSQTAALATGEGSTRGGVTEGETGTEGLGQSPTAASSSASVSRAAADLREQAARRGLASRSGAERTAPGRPGGRQTAAASQDGPGSSVSGSGSSRRGSTGRGTTGRSGTGRGNAGRAGTVPPGSVPVGVLPGATPGNSAPSGPAGQSPAAPPPGAAPDGSTPPTSGSPPASATPRLQRGVLPSRSSGPGFSPGSLSTLWEARA